MTDRMKKAVMLNIALVLGHNSLPTNADAACLFTPDADGHVVVPDGTVALGSGGTQAFALCEYTARRK